jgi:MoaA/NifB/PqqE/SkfB family radical SAM enzyme
MKKAGVNCVAISIDGARPETNDSFRGEEDSFYKDPNWLRHVGK